MANYKVIQDIEAEDKLIGPLSLRQFLYAGAAALAGYFCFLAIKNHLYPLLIFLPVMLLSGFFAFPWGRDQPTEVWALAKVKFFLIPRRRIWNQTGIKQMVTITAPKKLPTSYTNGLSQTEVKSRLQALADTIDSRGWAIKNAPNQQSEPSDRLVAASSLPRAIDDSAIPPVDDMFDEQNSQVSQKFDKMITDSTNARHASLLARMKKSTASSDDDQTSQATAQPTTPAQPDPASPPANYWFMNDSNPASAQQQSSQVVVPGTPEDEVTAAAAGQPTAEEEALSKKLRVNSYRPTVAYNHLKTLQPLSAKSKSASEPPAQKVDPTPTKPVTPAPDPAIIALANNNDLDVATIARQAHKNDQPDEVVVSLH